MVRMLGLQVMRNGWAVDPDVAPEGFVRLKLGEAWKMIQDGTNRRTSDRKALVYCVRLWLAPAGMEMTLSRNYLHDLVSTVEELKDAVSGQMKPL